MKYRDVLGIPAFRRLWLGQAISQLGDSFYFVIFMFMVQKITGSAAMVGYTGAAEAAPYLLLSLYGGVVADRIDRRKLMLASDVVSALVLVAFGVVVFIDGGKPPLASLFILPCLLSTARVFFMPAKNAAIPMLVPREHLGLANSLSSATQSLIPMVGLALSATVLSALYFYSRSIFFGSVVFIDALSFAISALFIVRLPKLEPDRKASEIGHPFTDLKDGLAYVRGSHVLTVQTILSGAFTLCISPFFVVYLAANDRWFGGNPNTLAWFEFAFSGGMVAGSMLVGRLRIKHVGYGVICGLGAVGVFVIAMGYSKNFWLFLTWNVACGLTIPFSEILVATWRALTVPDRFRGRVNSLQSLVTGGTQPIGMSAGGFLVQKLGLVAVFVLMGSGIMLACITGLFDTEFRRLELPEAGTRIETETGDERVPCLE